MNRFVKRALDVAMALPAVLFLLPFTHGLVWLFQRWQSPGPLLFRQERVGMMGQRFVMFKYRTMRVDHGHEAKQASKDDQRIYPAGRWFRKLSVDELPQFLNVLKGDMSLVGPRPPIPYELAAYEIWHRRRLLQVKPGITGLWQVMGRSRVPFDEMVRLDLHYASSWTPWLDFKILMRTPGAVIKGAY